MKKLIALVMLWPGLALAGGGGLAGLPPEVAKGILRDPVGYLDTATTLIAGFGQDGKLRADGIALMLDARRARARALAMVPLMAADLNGDGQVSETEAGQVAAIASAAERGRLARAGLKAETDGKPGLTAAELTGFGQAVAQAAVSPAEVARLQALIGFDADGDGAVTRDEVKAGLAVLERKAAQTVPREVPSGV